MKTLTRRLIMWGGAAAIASAGFAYMASNTVDASSAGVGSGSISGYHAMNVHYAGVPNTEGGSPNPYMGNVPGYFYIQGVLFQLDKPANEVKAWFSWPSGTYPASTSAGVSDFYNCVNVSDATGAELTDIEQSFYLPNTFNPNGYWDCGDANEGGGTSSAGTTPGGLASYLNANTLYVEASS
jgi:hypothetical protein